MLHTIFMGIRPILALNLVQSIWEELSIPTILVTNLNPIMKDDMYFVDALILNLNFNIMWLDYVP